MFTVKEVISGNEIIVSPKWGWKGYEGNRVFINGFLAPKEGEHGFEFAKNKIHALLVKNQIKHKKLKLVGPEFWDPLGNDILVCDILLDGVNIKNYFPEFQGNN